MALSKVTTKQVNGRSIEGMLYLTTEAKCPTCGAQNVYRHIESHYTHGRWYACQHHRAYNLGDYGLIESVEFEVAP